jgi:ferredoxin-NADP reductase
MTLSTVKLKDRREVAERTMGFWFEKPSGFTYKAGQFMDVTLLNPRETDAEGNTRAFSLASAPYEPMLMVATRVRDTAFKRVLAALPLGSEVKIDGPSGDLILHDDATRAAVFLAGGIGITPFRSILLRAAKERLAHHIFLFFANRRPEDTPFLEELQRLQGVNPYYLFVATMTGMAKSHRVWHGETGHITKAMLEKGLKKAVAPIYYLAGPPEMVAGLYAVLQDMNIKDDDIRKEEFSGY